MDKISDTLDLEPMTGTGNIDLTVALPTPEQPPQLPATTEPNKGPDYEQASIEDFAKARESMGDAIDKLKEGMTDVLQLARDSEHPRAYEVLADLARSVIEGSEKLANLSGGRARKTAAQNENKGGNTNILVVQSTAELLKMIKGKRVNASEE